MAKKISHSTLQHLIGKYFKFHPQQQKAFDKIGSGAYIFYGGARGGGKSHLALAAAVFVSMVYPGIRVIVVRATHDELYGNFITKLLDDYPEGTFGYRYKTKEKVAEWSNGSRIFFRSLESEADARKVKGLEYQFMIVDEANELPIALFKRLFGSLRSAKAEINLNFKPTILATGNPGGISDGYFKDRWVYPDYNEWSKSELKHKDRYVYIPAKVWDNPSVDIEEYVASLEQVGGDLKEAWLNGDWGKFEGQFFDKFDPDKHIVEYKPIPPHWKRWCGFDLGYTNKHPSVCLWLAQDPSTLDVYVYQEYTGFGAVAEQAAILSDLFQQEASMYKHEPLYSPPVVYADPAMWNKSTKKNSYDDYDALYFMKHGIILTQANNSRVEGWRIVKNWLNWNESRENKLKIYNNCYHLLKTLPTTVYAKGNGIERTKKEDCDTHGADDAIDALRYALVSGTVYPTKSEVGESVEAYKSIEDKIAHQLDMNTYSSNWSRGNLEERSTRYDVRSSLRTASTFI